MLFASGANSPEEVLLLVLVQEQLISHNGAVSVPTACTTTQGGEPPAWRDASPPIDVGPGHLLTLKKGHFPRVEINTRALYSHPTITHNFQSCSSLPVFIAALPNWLLRVANEPHH